MAVRCRGHLANIILAPHMLSIELYVRSIYNDNMGSFFSGKDTFKAASDKWQKVLKDYAADQGFIVRN